MASIKELVAPQNNPEYYQQFLCNFRGICLDPVRIDLNVLCDSERAILKMPTNGDSSLILKYRDKEGAALSMETESESLNIVQFQGARSSVSYKVTNGLLLPNLFGDQVEKIATHPHSHFERISMPPLEKIVGLCESGTDAAVDRYKRLANILGLRFSHEDYLFVRILK